MYFKTWWILFQANIAQQTEYDRGKVLNEGTGIIGLNSIFQSKSQYNAKTNARKSDTVEANCILKYNHKLASLTVTYVQLPCAVIVAFHQIRTYPKTLCTYVINLINYWIRLSEDDGQNLFKCSIESKKRTERKRPAKQHKANIRPSTQIFLPTLIQCCLRVQAGGIPLRASERRCHVS